MSAIYAPSATLLVGSTLGNSPPWLLPPVIENPWTAAGVIVLAYAITLGFSGWVVGAVIGTLNAPVAEAASSTTTDSNDSSNRDKIGRTIGKCENLIVVSFVLADQITGLALIFAAKSLVRKDDIQADAGYYLVGTLVNFVWSLMVAMIARVLIAGL